MYCNIFLVFIFTENPQRSISEMRLTHTNRSQIYSTITGNYINITKAVIAST